MCANMFTYQALKMENTIFEEIRQDQIFIKDIEMFICILLNQILNLDALTQVLVLE